METAQSEASNRQTLKRLAPIAFIDNDRAVSQSYLSLPSDEQEYFDNERYEHATSTTSHQRSTRHSVQPYHDDTNGRPSVNTRVYATYPEEHNSIGSAGVSTSSLVKGKLRSRDCWKHARAVVSSSWLWETLACIFSLACLASIVIVLLYEDGKQLDQWAWNIPPTAVISFIGTLSKSAIILVLSQVLSQLKWFHFRDTRSLEHIKTFDYASRGPVGSMMVIWSSKRWLASVAAGLMIATLLVDPFFQLVFSFPTNFVEDKSQLAAFNVSSIYVSNSTSAYAAFWTSINQGFLASNLTQAVTCPSGNCTWDYPIKTLGVCSSCSDVTPAVKSICAGSKYGYTNCSYTFPNGQVLVSNFYAWDEFDNAGKVTRPVLTVWNSTVDSRLTQMNISLDLDEQIRGNENLQVVNGTMMTFNAIQLQTSKDDDSVILPPARCWNCELYWCEWTYNGLEMTNSQPISTTSLIKERLWYVSGLSSPWDYEFEEEASYDYIFHPNDFEALQAQGNSKSRFPYTAQETITIYLRQLFNSFYVEQGEQDVLLRLIDQPGHTNLGDLPITRDTLVFSNDVSATIGKLADSLTEMIRTGDNSTSVVGRTMVPKSFIRVRWAWLALPLAIVILTCVLLIAVAFKSHLQNMAVWKSDPLALLFHHVNGVEVLSSGDNRSGPADLQSMADEIDIRLDENVPLTFLASVKKTEHVSRRQKKG